jgi:hypothetical protein
MDIKNPFDNRVAVRCKSGLIFTGTDGLTVVFIAEIV